MGLGFGDLVEEGEGVVERRGEREGGEEEFGEEKVGAVGVGFEDLGVELFEVGEVGGGGEGFEEGCGCGV